MSALESEKRRGQGEVSCDTPVPDFLASSCDNDNDGPEQVQDHRNGKKGDGNKNRDDALQTPLDMTSNRQATADQKGEGMGEQEITESTKSSTGPPNQEDSASATVGSNNSNMNNDDLDYMSTLGFIAGSARLCAAHQRAVKVADTACDALMARYHGLD